MSIYAQKQDMIDRYDEASLIELTARDNDAAYAINDIILDKALSDADSLINAYIAAKYKTPIYPIAPVLVMHACDIAWYKLHRSRYPEEVRKAYDDAISFLNRIASGQIRLDDGSSEPTSTAAIAQVSGPDRTFSRDKLGGY